MPDDLPEPPILADIRSYGVDVFAWCKLYIDQYGVYASLHAAIKADAMLERGDLDGFNVWMRIGRAIEDIQARAGGTRH